MEASLGSHYSLVSLVVGRIESLIPGEMQDITDAVVHGRVCSLEPQHAVLSKPLLVFVVVVHYVQQRVGNLCLCRR